MNLLLDTHAFLWFIEGSDELSERAKGLIQDQGNDRYLSVGSLWEMAIKVSIGKLNVPLPFTRLVREHVHGNAISILALRAPHLDMQRSLPFHHRDPFDRMIIAQAKTEKMDVVGRDQKFDPYDVGLLW